MIYNNENNFFKVSQRQINDFFNKDEKKISINEY
jgi:hypothetical protein